jgi:hypothetical protein
MLTTLLEPVTANCARIAAIKETIRLPAALQISGLGRRDLDAMTLTGSQFRRTLSEPGQARPGPRVR